jgi:hypothetical protein
MKNSEGDISPTLHFFALFFIFVYLTILFHCMAHLTIYQPEILFLSTQILTRYCTTAGYDFDTFCQGLTGYLRHYEHICEVMQDDINDYEKGVRYLALIQNKVLQNSLKKQMGTTEAEQRRFLKEQANSLSANVLRKLILESRGIESQSYKDSFVQACYLYIEKERSEFRQNATKLEKPDTIPPFGYGHSPANDNTISIFKKKTSFSLIPLKTDDDTIPEGKAALTFEGNKVQLNRNNLDKANPTITSKIQAEIRQENGEWVLVNESKLRTTFIQVNGPTKIKKGDIIVFGDQRFLFED